MRELKKTLISSLMRAPGALAGAGAGIGLSYAMGAQREDIALIAIVPGIAFFFVTRVFELLLRRPSKAKEPQFKRPTKKIEPAAQALILLVALTFFFGMTVGTSSLMYQVLGLHYVAVPTLKIALLALGPVLLAALSFSISLALGETLHPYAMWRAASSMLVFMLALPSSILAHSTDPLIHIKN